MTITRSWPVRCIALALMPNLLACSSWKVTPLAPRALVEDSRPEVVQVTRPQRLPVTVRDPFVRGDSLLGRVEGMGRETAGMRLDDVVAVKIRRFDPVKTVGFATFVTAMGVAILAAIGGVWFIAGWSKLDGQGID